MALDSSSLTESALSAASIGSSLTSTFTDSELRVAEIGFSSKGPSSSIFVLIDSTFFVASMVLTTCSVSLHTASIAFSFTSLSKESSAHLT